MQPPGLYFVFPENGELAIVFNLRVGAPLKTTEESIAAFLREFASFEQIEATRSDGADLALFLNPRTGVLVALRSVDPEAVIQMASGFITPSDSPYRVDTEPPAAPQS